MQKKALIGFCVFLLIMLGYDAGAGQNENKNGNDIFAGTWESVPASKNVLLIAANGKYKQLADGIEVINGTYTVSGNSVAIQIVQFNLYLYGQDNKLIPINELPPPYSAYISMIAIQNASITDNKFILGERSYIKISN